MRSDLSPQAGELNRVLPPSTRRLRRLTSCRVPPRILTMVPDQAAALLPDRFVRWFASRGWSPRQHQLDLLQKARDDRSALLIAPTGAGKTLAGFLPTLVELSVSTSPLRSSPFPREAVGRGRGWGIYPRVRLPANLRKHPPPPTPSRHALRARGEGRKAPRPPHPLHFAAEGAGGRCRAQSGDADRRDGAADQGRDPHRRHAGVAAAAAAALSAGHPADHARAAGAAAVVRRRAVSVRLAQAHRARRTARAGHLQARRPAGARPGAAVATGAAACARSACRPRWPSRNCWRGFLVPQRDGKAKPPTSSSPAAPRRPIVEMLDTRERLPWAGHSGAPRDHGSLRADKSQQDHAGVRQHPQPGRDAVPGPVADERRQPRRSRCITARSTSRSAARSRRRWRRANCAPWSAPPRSISASTGAMSISSSISARRRARRG